MEGKIVSWNRCLFLFVLCAGMLSVSAQSQAIHTADAAGGGTASAAANPVAEVREKQSWEFGPFLNGGTGVGERSDFKFFWGGVQGGKVLTPVLHAGILSGQFEFGSNIMPLWQAYTPAQHMQSYIYQGQPFLAPEGGGTFYGASLTPVILRWNFFSTARRFQPWFQGAGGLIYTTHKFPPSQLLPREGTSVWNFSPQGGVGVHFFTKPKRSIDLGVNAVHISSASLGDKNPGVNASVQIQVGYTYWK
jgi:hypothetical protein